MDIYQPIPQKSIADLGDLLAKSDQSIVVTALLSRFSGSSQLLESSLQDLAQEYARKHLFFFRIHADEHIHFLRVKVGVLTLPALLIIQNQEVKECLYGLTAKHKMRSHFSKYTGH